VLEIEFVLFEIFAVLYLYYPNSPPQLQWTRLHRFRRHHLPGLVPVLVDPRFRDDIGIENEGVSAKLTCVCLHRLRHVCIVFVVIARWVELQWLIVVG